MQLAVRLGIHTGLVVGEVGGGTRQEQLAPGRRPTWRPVCKALRHPIPW